MNHIMKHLSKTGACLLLLSLFSVAIAKPANAGTLEDAIESMAVNISSYLDEKGQRQILLGAFNGPGEATAGRAIRAQLKERLIEKDTTIVPLGANWTVRGQFSFEKTGSSAIVLIAANLFDKTGKEISGFREKVKVQEVSSIEDISRLLGLTVDLDKEQEDVASTSSSASESTNKTEIAKQLVSKQTVVTKKLASSIATPVFAFRNQTKTEISPDQNSKFRLELLVQRNGTGNPQAIAIQDAGGFPFAPLEANDIYRLKLYNDADHAVGVKLCIDGINSFCLSADHRHRELGTWYFPPKSTGLISGWYVSPTLLKEFVVTADGKNLGLPDASDLGTITAQFFHAWGENEQPPAVELLATNRGQLRTGIGRDISRQGGFQQSFFGKTLLSSISVRYSIPDDLPTDSDLN